MNVIDSVQPANIVYSSVTYNYVHQAPGLQLGMRLSPWP